MTTYFYDSYAIIEILRKNPFYEKYFLNNRGITTYYNGMEIYYALLREEGKLFANKVLRILLPLIEQPIFEDIEASMLFRLEHKEKKFSYADCLGYVMAKRKKIQFLTGDEAFKGLSNVLFVK